MKKDKGNVGNLYLVVSMEKIKRTSVLGRTIDTMENVSTKLPDTDSIYSLYEIIKNVNPKDYYHREQEDFMHAVGVMIYKGGSSPLMICQACGSDKKYPKAKRSGIRFKKKGILFSLDRSPTGTSSRFIISLTVNINRSSVRIPSRTVHKKTSGVG